MSDVILEVRDIAKRFGVTQALDDVSVDFRAGEVHALMGENGAGKSTLGKVIAGLHRPDVGQVRIRAAGDRGFTTLPPGDLDAAFAAGIRIVHQELAQCPNLTVAENLCLHDLPRGRLGLVDRRTMRVRAARLLAELEPSIDVDAPLGTLSPGHRQIVQIAGALDDGGRHGAGGGGGGGGRVIVFDEPTSSLSIAEVERLLKIVRDLAARGLAIIYVSHRMGEIFAACDRVTVLRDGKYVATSDVASIDEPALVEQMIGRRLPPHARAAASAEGQAAGEVSAIQAIADDGRSARHAGDVLLEVRNISSPGRVRDVSLNVRAGEVLGIGGLVGAGRSELLDAMFGLDKRATGAVRIAGQPIRRGDPRAMIRAGAGYIPEDRKLQGLFFLLGVGENILLPYMPRLARFGGGWGLRNLRAERAHVRERIGIFQIKAASPAVPPSALSGGNQQKLLIARWMGESTRVLLLDEPTRGIDVGTKSEIYRLVRHAASQGAAVVLISSEMPELLALSDRIAVMCGGRITGELSGAEMTQERILRLATLE